jgi:hypothetical protein
MTKISTKTTARAMYAVNENQARKAAVKELNIPPVSVAYFGSGARKSGASENGLLSEVMRSAIVHRLI